MKNKNILRLPQGEFTYSFAWQDEYLFLAGGRVPQTEWLTAATGTRKIWAIDGGLNIVRQHNLRPELILGDGDSAAPDVWEWGSRLNVRRLTFPRAKDYTDMQLALAETDRTNTVAMAVIGGAFGGRSDHLFSAVFSVANAQTHCCLADETEIVAVIKDGQRVSFRLNENCTPPSVVSLLPLTETVGGVTTHNLRWNLADAELQLSRPNTVSNEMTTRDFSVELTEGILGVYMFYG